MSFDEAIAHFLRRQILSPEAFDRLTDAERLRAFTIRSDAAAQIREHAFELLSAALEPDGPGLREFIRQIQADEVALGFTPQSPHYLENVYRTTTATSYNAGRLTQQRDPFVVASTGFWQYVTAGDNRVRDSHAKLHGKQWKIGDAQAEAVYPPNGFQCRCAMVVIDAEDVDRASLERAVDAAADDGFSGPPDAAIAA